jgi:hypothetical protein
MLRQRLRAALSRAYRRMTGDWWIVKRYPSPFPHGYAAFHRKRKAIFDSCMTLEDARATVKELNQCG